jgi:Tol biopolymer transport system component
MATSGGESVQIPTPLKDARIYDISSNHSELLLGGAVVQKLRELWVLPIPSGPPYRVGDILVRGASWAPDGIHITYVSANDVYIVKKDGTESQKLTTVPDVPGMPKFSPDGRRIRFTVVSSAKSTLSLWEIASDGKDLHPLLPNAKKSLQGCCGVWSHDGNYFFFQTFLINKSLDQDIWVMAEPRSIFQKSSEPVRLTSGPLFFGSPAPGSEARKLFVRGTQARAEVIRYDSQARNFVPYLSGISASDVDISRDRQWVTYVSYPEFSLWRSKADGSERMQLAFPPVEPFLPRWSPDGTQIVFTDLQPGKTAKIYTVSREGGPAREVIPEENVNEIDPTWSADGKSIVFGRSHQDLTLALYRVEVKTHQVSKIPGSEGFTSPRLSPDGRHLAALSQDWMKLMLYEFQTEKWVELAAITTGALGYLNWSHDGKYIYAEDFSKGLDIVRVSTRDHKIEHVVDVKDLPQPSPTWMGLASDDSPLLRRDKSTQEIYALDLQLP